MEVLGSGRPSVLPGKPSVVLEDLLRARERSVRGAGRHPTAGCGFQPLVAVGGKDDRRMWLLDRPGPDRDPIVSEVLPAPVEGLAGGPRLDDQIPRLAQPLPRIVERAAQRQVLLGHPAHKSGDDAAARHAVEHRDLFGQPDRIVVKRGQVTEDRDLDATRALTERGRDEIRGRHQAVGFGVVLVDSDGVNPYSSYITIWSRCSAYTCWARTGSNSPL